MFIIFPHYSSTSGGSVLEDATSILLNFGARKLSCLPSRPSGIINTAFKEEPILGVGQLDSFPDPSVHWSAKQKKFLMLLTTHGKYKLTPNMGGSNLALDSGGSGV